jgi:hypothetical protein
MSVHLSVLDLLRLDHRLVWAPTSTTYEGWVAAGKPCLRRNCGHHHGSHIPSEGMECNECDCLGFVSFAQQGLSSPTDPNRARLRLSRKRPDHDRHNC